ncbi:MAG TPA: hypothetical protein VFQ38_01565 [Longimicrobiales bacterium]|nr:hypothetical protein [Longimicrobiales bacterium]
MRDSTSSASRALRWLVPAGIVLDIGLFRSGLVSGRAALALGAALEVVTLGVAGVLAGQVVRRYRTERRAGVDAWMALEDGVALLLPRAAAGVVVLELRLWTSLWVWAARRRRPGPSEFSYRRGARVGLVLALVLLTTPVEVLALELLIPWRWLRIVLAVSAVYAVFWVAGLYGSLAVLPHRLEATGARFRYGALASVFVPYAAMESVSLEKRPLPGGRPGLRLAADGAAYLSATDRAAVTIRVPGGVAIRRVTGETAPVTTLHLGADTPDALLAALRERIAAAAPLPV